MKIILDANIITADFHLRSTSFAILRKRLSKDITVLVPRIVIDETVNNYEEELRKLDKMEHRLHRRVVEPEVDRAEEYRGSLIEKLEMLNGSILEIPQVSHESLVRRDIMGKRPFHPNGQGRGYRDALIWLSVVHVASESSDAVFFISDNNRDFAIEGDVNKLHPDLVADLEERKIDTSRVRLVHKLDTFVEEVLVPRLTPLDKVALDLERSNFESLNLLDALQQHKESISAKIADEMEYLLDIVGRYNAIRGFRLGNPERLDAVVAFSLDETSMFIKVQVHYPVQADIDDFDFEGSNQWYKGHTLTAVALVNISLIFDIKESKVDRLEVQKVEKLTDKKTISFYPPFKVPA